MMGGIIASHGVSTPIYCVQTTQVVAQYLRPSVQLDAATGDV
jgi:hypothetical protein